MSLLTEILEVKAGEVAAARATRPIGELEAGCRAAGPARSLIDALRRPADAPVRAIAEFKRASPSAGPIRPDAEPEPIAREYAGAGAAAISVLTDRTYFAGDLAFLARVRAAVSLPILRKDFVIDPYQVVEARAAGADAVLLIVAALGATQLSELMAEAARVGLDVLVEVHSEAEAERAVAAGAPLIGVNHRNLATLEIDMTLTGRLRGIVPPGCVLVGESGIKTPADVARLRDAGADAILVGESLMKAPSPGAALRALLGSA